ncbi:MAG: heparan-alpha-glucosaminide N-acetyltransferase domain-containing protein [Polyangiaceae bacterium]|jgi:uncharacterized membrane protein
MRLRAIDWVRGLVIALMTVDHAGGRFDAAHMHGDDARRWIAGSPLPAGEFLTRWVTHLCAPMFLLLAGASLAFSDEKRRGEPGQTRFIVTRGLLIAALDPLWMSLGFGDGYDRLVFQVLYAIGASMVCMAALRRLPSWALLAGGVAIQLTGERTKLVHPSAQPWQGLWAFLFVGGPVGRAVCAYPLVPWLSYMMIGWALGRWMLVPQPRGARARALMLGGAGLLGLFAVVRGIDGYGNGDLHRDSSDVLQWLHVSKYPPSLSYGCLELGLGLLVLAAFVALDDPERPRRALAGLGLLGSTAFFYYVLHVHLMRAAQEVLRLDRQSAGLAKTWVAAAVVLAVLVAPCAWWRRYKRAHPDGWARYV